MVLPSVCPDTNLGWTWGLFPFLFPSGLVKSILHCSFSSDFPHPTPASHPFILSEADQTHSLLAVYYLCIYVIFPSKVQRWTWLCHLEKLLKHQQSHVNPIGKHILPSEMREKITEIISTSPFRFLPLKPHILYILFFPFLRAIPALPHPSPTHNSLVEFHQCSQVEHFPSTP